MGQPGAVAAEVKLATAATAATAATEATEAEAAARGRACVGRGTFCNRLPPGTPRQQRVAGARLPVVRYARVEPRLLESFEALPLD